MRKKDEALLRRIYKDITQVQLERIIDNEINLSEIEDNKIIVTIIGEYTEEMRNSIVKKYENKGIYKSIIHETVFQNSSKNKGYNKTIFQFNL